MSIENIIILHQFILTNIAYNNIFYAITILFSFIIYNNVKQILKELKDYKKHFNIIDSSDEITDEITDENTTYFTDLSTNNTKKRILVRKLNNDLTNDLNETETKVYTETSANTNTDNSENTEIQNITLKTNNDLDSEDSFISEITQTDSESDVLSETEYNTYINGNNRIKVYIGRNGTKFHTTKKCKYINKNDTILFEMDVKYAHRFLCDSCS